MEAKEEKKATRDPQILVISVELRSVNPGMLMNPKTEDVLWTLYTGQKSTKPKGQEKPEDLAKTKLYRDENGRIGIPAGNLFACLVEAGRMVEYKKKRMISTKDSSLLAGLIEIEEEFLPFGEGTEWKTSMMGGNLKQGGSKTAVAIVRPRFPRWNLAAKIQIDERFVDEEVIKKLFIVAGRFIGLGDFRAICKGRFGKFTVAKWEVIERLKPEEDVALELVDEEGTGEADGENAGAAATAKSKRGAKSRKPETVGASAVGLSPDGDK